MKMEKKVVPNVVKRPKVTSIKSIAVVQDGAEPTKYTTTVLFEAEDLEDTFGMVLILIPNLSLPQHDTTVFEYTAYVMLGESSIQDNGDGTFTSSITSANPVLPSQLPSFYVTALTRLYQANIEG